MLLKKKSKLESNWDTNTMHSRLSKTTDLELKNCTLALLLTMITGCGLADYEAKMDAAQKRLEYLDKESVYLGDPIEPPPVIRPATEEGAPKPKPIDLFFRPPRGIATKYEAMPVGSILYRYLRDPLSSQRIAPRTAGQPIKSPPEFQEVLVAMSADRSRDEFWNDILNAFGGVDAKNMTREIKQPLGRQPLTFDKLPFNVSPPPTSYFVFVYEAQNVHVAIIFSVKQDKAADAEVANAMDFSLKSLAVGPEALRLKQQYHPIH
jgi:hypothetical protein